MGQFVTNLIKHHKSVCLVSNMLIHDKNIVSITDSHVYDIFAKCHEKNIIDQ
jgi:hypothetical protein